MAVKLVSFTDISGVRNYHAETTDLEASYPVDCKDGSTMKIFNVATKELADFKVFHNGSWYTA